MLSSRQKVYLAVISLSYILRFNLLKSEEGPDFSYLAEQIQDLKGCKKVISPSPAPFSTDYEAIEERRKCNYSLKITSEMARTGTAPRKIRVYATGVWDLFHKGHAECLRQAKQIFPLCEVHLIVGIPSDSLTHPIKGLTVLSDRERAETLRHVRYVDEVLTDAPWTFTQEFFSKNKIDFLAHDEEPYSMGATKDDVYAEIKANDMFAATQRTEGVSTSGIISSILKRHDEFVARNIKRGVSKTDLGLKNVTG